jgi:hypothetical protein
LQNEPLLAAKVANQYRRYGLPLGDLIAEANLDLALAATRFEPGRGSRFFDLCLVVDQGYHPGIHSALMVPRQDRDDFNPKEVVLSSSGRDEESLRARRLAEQPPTLDHLGREMSISPERVRQIEARAFAKVQRAAWKHLRPGAEYVIDPSHRSPLEHQSASSRSAAQSQELQHEPVL